jgi:methyltransferase (TIGR00027 family)
LIATRNLKQLVDAAKIFAGCGINQSAPILNMPSAAALIRNISDTALWAAIYRARETERADALFRDPLARRLAGQRGEEIAAAIPFSNKHTWSWVTRTVLFDRLIAEQIQQGVDLVVNLAAGLDARPYRMQLPAMLKWVEVDLPEMIDYKEEMLASEKPVCALQRVRLDLGHVEQRRALVEHLGRESSKALVLTEGLIIYLTAEEVSGLARDLATPPSFQRWISDLASPALVKMLQAKMGGKLGEGNAKLQFGPAEGPDFFRPCGWRSAKTESLLHTAKALKRLPFMLRLVARFSAVEFRPGSKPWSGVCLLQRESRQS